MDGILVSIWCATYNHELYIRDAIESFLMQKTNFKYEIIIHDDASTDKTAEIIKEYAEKYPDLIHAIYQTKNQYSENQLSCKWVTEIKAKNCKGKYIAVCDGDDYWIDAQKLQLQVDYLETHPECMMVVHDAVNVDCRNYEMKSGSIYARDCVVPAEDIIIQNKYMFSASMMYRSEILQMDDFFLNARIFDYPCLLYCLTKGNVYYCSRIMSIYRQHRESSWSYSYANEERARWVHGILMLDFLQKYNEYTKKKYGEYIISRIQRYADTIISSCSGMTKGEFSNQCKKYIGDLGEKYQLIFEQLERLRAQIFDESYINQEVINFINKYSKIIIMGAGTYAGILAQQLENHGYKFEGFAVSDDQQIAGNYMEKPVWKLSELPFGLEDTGVLVGINPSIWDEILFSLKQCGVENYICPFLYGFR